MSSNLQPVLYVQDLHFWIAQVEYQLIKARQDIPEFLNTYLFIDTYYRIGHISELRYFSLAQFLPHRRAAHRSV